MQKILSKKLLNALFLLAVFTLTLWAVFRGEDLPQVLCFRRCHVCSFLYFRRCPVHMLSNEKTVVSHIFFPLLPVCFYRFLLLLHYPFSFRRSAYADFGYAQGRYPRCVFNRCIGNYYHCIQIGLGLDWHSCPCFSSLSADDISGVCRSADIPGFGSKYRLCRRLAVVCISSQPCPVFGRKVFHAP